MVAVHTLMQDDAAHRRAAVDTPFEGREEPAAPMRLRERTPRRSSLRERPDARAWTPHRLLTSLTTRSPTLRPPRSPPPPPPPPAGADEAGHQAINTKKIVSPMVLVSVPVLVPYHCEESSAIATWNFYLWQWGHASVRMTCMYLAACTYVYR